MSQTRFAWLVPGADNQWHAIRRDRDDEYLSVCGMHFLRFVDRNPRGQRITYTISVVGWTPSEKAACPTCLGIVRKAMAA